MSFGRHPKLFGATGKAGWLEVWAGSSRLLLFFSLLESDYRNPPSALFSPELEPLARKVIGGEVVSKDDQLFFLQRDDGKEEERYFSWSFVSRVYARIPLNHQHY